MEMRPWSVETDNGDWDTTVDTDITQVPHIHVGSQLEPGPWGHTAPGRVHRAREPPESKYMHYVVGTFST